MEGYNKDIFNLTDEIQELIKKDFDVWFSVQGNGSLLIKHEGKEYKLTITEINK